MIGLLTKGISKVFGSKSDKDIKTVMPYVDATNKEYAKLAAISDDQLRGKTTEVRGIIAKSLESIDSELEKLNKSVKEDKLDVAQKEVIYEQIDKLEEDRNVALEKVLLEVLPQAFAIVKETARRLGTAETFIGTIYRKTQRR